MFSGQRFAILAMFFLFSEYWCHREGQPRGGEISSCNDLHFLLYIFIFRILIPLWRTAGTNVIVKDSLIMWPGGQWEALKKIALEGDNKQTHRQTDIATLWKNRPKSRFFENLVCFHPQLQDWAARRGVQALQAGHWLVCKAGTSRVLREEVPCRQWPVLARWCTWRVRYSTARYQ